MYKYLLIFSLILIGVNFAYSEPYVVDKNFIVEKYVTDLRLPTSMTFVGDDIILLEKGGDARIIRDGILEDEPILKIAVDPRGEGGLLGITTLDSEVYLYFTEARNLLGEPIGNRIYKYTWDGESLKNKKLVMELPVEPKISRHSAGILVTSQDGRIFTAVGDQENDGILQNYGEGELTDTSVIIHVNLDESVLKPSLAKNPLDYYYAMGIRNTFGLDFDPITGELWQTENGVTSFDEVNLVKRKFNSGWEKIMGPATQEQIDQLPGFYDYEYSDPEFSWEKTSAPTAIIFPTSNLFEDYQDYVFVGGFNSGIIYQFKLNSERTGFSFEDDGLKDLVLNPEDPRGEIVFATGIPGITDLDFGPDGFLYAVSFGIEDGSIYRIIPNPDLPQDIKYKIPQWLKNNVSWWMANQIDDSTFIHGIQFLIENHYIIIPEISVSQKTTEAIPEKSKSNSSLWADDKISDEEFGAEINFLVTEGFIQLNPDKMKCSVPLTTRVDLSGCNVSNREFSNIDLSLSNFKNSIFVDGEVKNSKMNLGDFSGADLSNSKFQGVSFNSALFSGATMKGTIFEGSDLTDAFMKNAQLPNSIFSGSVLNQVNLQNSNLRGADLRNITSNQLDLTGADLNNTKMNDSHLKAVKLWGRNLQDFDFSGSYLHLAKFGGADLSRANFKDATLSKATFKNANLSFANLQNANLKEAWLNNANLTNADLTGASLIAADLSNAILLNAKIKNVDFYKANMTNCIGCP